MYTKQPTPKRLAKYFCQQNATDTAVHVEWGYM